MPLASLPKEFVVALLDTMKPTVASNWLTALRALSPKTRKVTLPSGPRTTSIAAGRLALALGIFTPQRDAQDRRDRAIAHQQAAELAWVEGLLERRNPHKAKTFTAANGSRRRLMPNVAANS
jgi:hypothetical protein